MDGHLYSWGEGSEGQLGVGTLIKKSLTPQRIHREDFVFSDVNCGANHTVALTDAGDCYAWGRGFEGQTGICDKNLSLEQNDLVHGYQPVPRHIAPLLGKRVIRVDCGENFTCVITGNGEIWSFGEAQSGQTGHGRLTRQLNPTLTIDKGVNGSPFVNVACGASHALALTLEGDLYAWGFNVYGQLGLGDTKTRFTPELVPDIKLQRIYAAGHYSCGITENGSVYTWGAGTHGQLGHGSTDHEPSPRLVKQTESIHVSALACGAADLMFFVPTWISNTHPVRGPISGHTTLTISGSGFWESDDITIRFVPTTDERLPRAALGDYDPETKQISCQTPKFALPGEVTLELAMNGKHFTGTGDVFDVFCPPEILACSPDEASSAGGSEITVIVQGFVKSDEAYMRFVNFDLPFQSSMVSCVLESLSVDSGEVLGPEAVNLPNEAVQTRIKGCTPDFQLDNLIRGSVELSFNAVDFMPVSILNEESNNRIPKQIIFHRAQIIRLKPNNIEIGKAFAFEIEGHDIFDLGQNELHVEFIDEKGDGSSVSAKALDMEVDEEKNLIRCKLPNLSQWEYSTPGESDEEEKIKTNPKWWKKYDYLRIQPKVSLNGGKSFLPTAPNAVLHYITSGTVDAIAPLYVPFSGGTELKLTGSTYPFDTPDAQLKFSFGANLVKLVPASYAQDGSCWTFTAPVFESKPPVVSEEDDAQEPSTTSQVSIFASLNGRTYFEAPIQLTYYGKW